MVLMRRKGAIWLFTIYFLLTQSVFASLAFAQESGTSRIAGEDRYQTAAAISQKGWQTSDYAVLARGDDFADALCAGPLAQKYSGPILLTEPQSLNADTLAELQRLGVKHLFIAGGTGAIAQNVEDELKAGGIATLERIYGETRYDTSVKIAEKLGNPEKAVLVTGHDFPDALSISVVAAKLGLPILLTSKNDLPTGVSNYFRDHPTITQTYIVGGPGVISADLESEVPNPVRLAGHDRYATNIAVLDYFASSFDFKEIFVAIGGGSNGNEFADALTGAVLAAKSSSPLILTAQSLPQQTRDYLETKLSLSSNITALGGQAVVSPAVLAEIVACRDQAQFAQRFSTAGTYGPETGVETIDGNVTISAADVTLRNTIIEGDLLLAQSIGDGNVYLKDVTVKGKTLINGGGPNSIIMYNFNGVTVTVDVPEGSNVRLVAQGDTNIANVIMESNGQLEEAELTGLGFVDIVIPANAQVSLAGNFNEVDVQASGANVTVTNGTISAMTISETARGAEISLAKGTTVTTLNADTSATISGQGRISKANIDANNVIIDQTPGKTTVADGITAKVGGKTLKGTKTSSSGGGGSSSDGGDSTVSVTGISINEADQELKVGATLPLTTKIEPTNATNKNVTWASSDENVATVNNNGLVAAIAKGEATITVTTVAGNMTDNINVTVVEEEVEEGVSTYKFSHNIPEKVVENKEVEFDVTFKTDSKGAFGYNNVFFAVKADKAEGEGTVSFDIEFVDAEGTETYQFSNQGNWGARTILPADYTKTTHWKLTFSEAGEYTITFSLKDDASKEVVAGITETVPITVEPAESGDIPVTGITVSGAGGATEITTKGETLEMSAVVTPENATDKTVTWSVAPAGIATIDDNGLLTAVANGTVTVRVTANDGSTVFGEKEIKISGQGVSFVTGPEVELDEDWVDAVVEFTANQSGKAYYLVVNKDTFTPQNAQELKEIVNGEGAPDYVLTRGKQDFDVDPEGNRFDFNYKQNTFADKDYDLYIMLEEINGTFSEVKKVFFHTPSDTILPEFNQQGTPTGVFDTRSRAFIITQSVIDYDEFYDLYIWIVAKDEAPEGLPTAKEVTSSGIKYEKQRSGYAKGDTITYTGLTPNTAYMVYMVAQDYSKAGTGRAGLFSEVLSREATTKADTNGPNWAGTSDTDCYTIDIATKTLNLQFDGDIYVENTATLKTQITVYQGSGASVALAAGDNVVINGDTLTITFAQLPSDGFYLYIANEAIAYKENYASKNNEELSLQVLFPEVDSTAIDIALAAATAAKEDVLISLVDGTDVDPANQWVSQEVNDTLDLAISTATDAKSTVTTDEEVADAAATLNGAVDSYNAAKANGTKTPAVIEITTVDGLKAISQGLDKNYKLANDIDLTEVSAGWVPIGYSTKKFTGTFDGNGKKIIGFKITYSYIADYFGLFGATGENAVIKNVGLESVSIGSVPNAYALGALAGYNDGTVSNSYVKGSNSESAEIRGNDNTGGLVGINSGSGKIIDSFSDIWVSCNTMKAGGLVGTNSGIIQNSYAKGKVIATAAVGGRAMGGLVGANSSDGIIQDSYATGEVRSSYDVGGLVGSNLSGRIENSYATGDVYGRIQGVGGLVGSSSGGTIRNSEARNGRIYNMLQDASSSPNFYGRIVGKLDYTPILEGNYASDNMGYSYYKKEDSSWIETPRDDYFKKEDIGNIGVDKKHGENLSQKNKAPVATAVNVASTPKVGAVLTGTYTYSDEESNPEGASTFRWLSSTTVEGQYSPITGATAKTFTLPQAQIGNYIQFEVVPVASEGYSPGVPAISTPIGPVIEDEPELQAPVVGSVSTTTAAITLRSNFIGTIYWRVYDVNNGLPTSNLEIKNATRALLSGEYSYEVANLEQRVNIESLNPRTEYEVYIFQKNAEQEDSEIKSSEIFTTIPPDTYLYYADFSTSDGEFTKSEPPAGFISSWEWGPPTPSIGGEDTNVWATNLDGNYSNKEIAFLVSPAIDMSEVQNTDKITISWKQWHKFDSWYDMKLHDGGYVELSRDGGTTWEDFSGKQLHSSERWVTKSRANLTGLKCDDLRIRFHFRSNDYDTDLGWYIKDLAIFKTYNP